MRKRVPGIVFVIILICSPLIIKNSYLIHLLIMCCIYGVLVSSWDILSGYGGIFSFGHPIFFALGAYSSALMALNLDVSPWLGLLIGGGIASVAGFFIGFPVLRLRGPYVAIVTVSFLIIGHQICTNWVSLTHGPTGLSGIPPLPNISILGVLINFDGINRVPYYYVAALILAIATLMQTKFVNSSTGLHLVAIREEEVAASAMGVNLAKPKIIAFVLTSFFAGMIGAFYAHYIMLVSPALFGFPIMITILTMSLLGGAGTTFGPIMGAFLLTFISEYLREFGDYRFLIYGLFIIIAISFMPQGILPGVWKYFRSTKILRLSMDIKKGK